MKVKYVQEIFAEMTKCIKSHNTNTFKFTKLKFEEFT